MPSSRSCISLASRRSVRSGASPERETIRIGNSEKLISSIVYCSAPSGKSASAWFILSRTSARVSPLFQPNSNSRKTPAKFSDAVAVISFKPSSSFSFVSIGLTSSFSASLAEMPGKGTETNTPGMSMSGSPSFGSET